ncbi:MAG: hypothetical protein U9Q63_04000 [Patescibacteria group bacterium]|nr:hypothetical protein [Patescibacteria group bacterium]
MKKSLKVLVVLWLVIVMTTSVVMGRAGNKGLGVAVQSLERVAERINNPEVGEQVKAMVQNHERVQVRTKTTLKKMNQRNQAVKLLVGPDYKNAGQVRSDVVGLRNDIKQLTKIQESVLPIDAGEVQGAIDELQTEADELEAQLVEQTSGFSLFGWLGKLLAKY